MEHCSLRLLSVVRDRLFRETLSDVALEVEDIPNEVGLKVFH